MLIVCTCVCKTCHQLGPIYCQFAFNSTHLHTLKTFFATKCQSKPVSSYQRTGFAPHRRLYWRVYEIIKLMAVSIVRHLFLQHLWANRTLTGCRSGQMQHMVVDLVDVGATFLARFWDEFMATFCTFILAKVTNYRSIFSSHRKKHAFLCKLCASCAQSKPIHVKNVCKMLIVCTCVQVVPNG